jgi:hypothetical protein
MLLWKPYDAATEYLVACPRQSNRFRHSRRQQPVRGRWRAASGKDREPLPRRLPGVD